MGRLASRPGLRFAADVVEPLRQVEPQEFDSRGEYGSAADFDQLPARVERRERPTGPGSVFVAPEGLTRRFALGIDDCRRAYGVANGKLHRGRRRRAETDLFLHEELPIGAACRAAQLCAVTVIERQRILPDCFAVDERAVGAARVL